jgi:hypothetical protein
MTFIPGRGSDTRNSGGARLFRPKTGSELRGGVAAVVGKRTLAPLPRSGSIADGNRCLGRIAIRCYLRRRRRQMEGRLFLGLMRGHS